MAIAIVFTPVGMDAGRYGEVIRRLEAVGAGAPRGRIFHACYGSADQLGVLDVWESPEAFAEFGGTLMPILRDVGVDPGQPAVHELHNLIAGNLPAALSAS